MIEQKICFAVVYLAEALTVWQFFGELFSPRRPTWVRGILFGVGYGLAWLCFALDFVHVNVLIFAACTGLILYIGYTVGIGKACSIRGIVVCAYAGYRISVNAVSWGFF